MKQETIAAAVAGLLHDIGKMEQRARTDPWNPAPGVEREGQPVHATWSIYFAQQYVTAAHRPAALAGAYHHAPQRSPAADKSLSELIALADKLSAGERADPEDVQKKPPRQMVTIFDQVRLHDTGKAEGWHYLPLKTLRLDEASLFPQAPVSDTEEIQAYETLRLGVETAARLANELDEAYIENLLASLQRAGLCVPSSYYHSVPDVSLYDHSRMTAALAVCLSEKYPEKVHALLGAVERDFRNQPQSGDQDLTQENAALLVGGDISGVQDFLYTISSKGAARMLRGRSFYLQLLGEAVLRFVLHRLDLPYCNVIYSGGGHFFLLAPTSAADHIPAIRKEITQKLLDAHGTGLYLAIGYTQVPLMGCTPGGSRTTGA